jgi:hypothetical protein
MASGTARAVRVTHRATGKIYWADKRAGFSGLEYDFGAGWRPSRSAAFTAAQQAGELREATAPGPPPRRTCPCGEAFTGEPGHDS